MVRPYKWVLSTNTKDNSSNLEATIWAHIWRWTDHQHQIHIGKTSWPWPHPSQPEAAHKLFKAQSWEVEGRLHTRITWWLVSHWIKYSQTTQRSNHVHPWHQPHAAHLAASQLLMDLSIATRDKKLTSSPSSKQNSATPFANQPLPSSQPTVPNPSIALPSIQNSKTCK